MLGKVMKYELRASARLLLPLFAIALAASALLRGLIEISPYIWQPARSILSGLAGSLGMLFVVAVGLLAFVAVVVRFYQSMLAQESYLTFTLPVKPSTHIIGRLIAESLWACLGILVCFACAFILIPGIATTFAAGASVPVHVGTASSEADFVLKLSDIPADIWGGIIIGLLLFILISVVTNLLRLYASMAVGTAISKNRIIGSVVAYFLLNAIESVLALPLLLVPFLRIFGFSNQDFAQRMDALMTADAWESMRNLFRFTWGAVLLTIALSLVLAVAHYFITRYFFTKKLNLE